MSSMLLSVSISFLSIVANAALTAAITASADIGSGTSALQPFRIPATPWKNNLLAAPTTPPPPRPRPAVPGQLDLDLAAEQVCVACLSLAGLPRQPDRKRTGLVAGEVLQRRFDLAGVQVLHPFGQQIDHRLADGEISGGCQHVELPGHHSGG